MSRLTETNNELILATSIVRVKPDTAGSFCDVAAEKSPHQMHCSTFSKNKCILRQEQMGFGLCATDGPKRSEKHLDGTTVCLQQRKQNTKYRKTYLLTFQAEISRCPFSSRREDTGFVEESSQLYTIEEHTLVSSSTSVPFPLAAVCI